MLKMYFVFPVMQRMIALAEMLPKHGGNDVTRSNGEHGVISGSMRLWWNGPLIHAHMQ